MEHRVKRDGRDVRSCETGTDDPSEIVAAGEFHGAGSFSISNFGLRISDLGFGMEHRVKTQRLEIRGQTTDDSKSNGQFVD